MKLTLRTYGDAILRQKATPVTSVDDRVRTLAQDMLETMHAEEGVGLAAQQVGALDALCVVDIPTASDADPAGQPLNPGLEMPLILINPVIRGVSEETESWEEGCLSFPEIRAPVERPKEIEVQFSGLDGLPVVRRVRGLAARCIQHELDHLNAVLICDRMSPVKRIALSGRLKRLRRETEHRLNESHA